MVRTAKAGFSFLSCLIILMCVGCSSPGGKTPEGSLYTRYNLHYVEQKGNNVGSYANFTDYEGHDFLPYNSKVEIKKWKRGYRITAVESDTVILFDYKKTNMAGMPGSEYLDLILSSVPVSYSGLSAEDQQGIEQGKAMKGMTKQGVMIALGYPAKHRTPSLDSNSWAYWRGRFGEPRLVEFDENGKVVAIVD